MEKIKVITFLNMTFEMFWECNTEIMLNTYDMFTPLTFEPINALADVYPSR